MSIEIKDMSCRKKKSKPCWNDMEELKYLICMIDSWYARNIYINRNDHKIIASSARVEGRWRIALTNIVSSRCNIS